MKELIKALSEPLTKDDVELRIGTVSAKGFSLLLYKTARTDIKRLNDTGAIWQNKHEYDTMGLLTCTISIYDKEHALWVNRVDVGTEGQTEKQKGLYSDSFKRAGFRWGIGLELYNAPFIWINWEVKEFNGRKTPVNFFSSNLAIADYTVKDGHFTKLLINYSGKEIFKIGKPQPKQEVATPKTISQAQAKSLTDYAKERGKSLKDAPSMQGVQKLSDLTIDGYQQAMYWLKA